MGFKTKLDYSNNRQIKQHLETLTTLSGGTSFGITFADLTKGPNLATSGATEEYTLIASTFSGNNTTTIYTWYDPRMELGHPYLSALTPTTSAETQTVDPVFAPSASVTIDGNVVNTAFTGVTFDVSNIIMIDLGSGNYAGTVEHSFFDVLSANTAEFTGRTIWTDVSGITRTERLIVTNNPIVGNILTCIDSEGMSSWSSLPFDITITGGTYSAGTAIFTNNSGGTFNVTGFTTGTTTYWSAGTGSDAIVTKNSGNQAIGFLSLAEGNLTIASGNASHAEGYLSQANGNISHAQGNNTRANGIVSHAEGSNSIASGNESHAEGYNTIASGSFGAHAEGYLSIASGNNSHAEGWGSIASGFGSHAEGGDNIGALSGGTASGRGSHAEGAGTIASGITSHAEGKQTVAGGDNSHAGGYQSTSNGFTSFIHGYQSVVNGNYSIVLGRNLTGNTADTTYVDNFNIKNVPSGTPINNLGIDATGNVVIGTVGSGGTSYWSAGTGTNAIATIGGGNIASGTYSVAEGNQTTASGFLGGHSEGYLTIASGTSAHAEGRGSIAGGHYSHAGGLNSESYGQSSHAEGQDTTARGDASHSEGTTTLASGDSSHAEGFSTIANGDNSHAEGRDTIANGYSSHAEGVSTTANTYASHSEGYLTQALGDYAHAEGVNTIASGHYSHAEGWDSIASGFNSHAQGKRTKATSDYTHASGYQTTASGYASFVHGYNSESAGGHTIVLGRNITGNTNDTTYVDQFNIKNVGAGPGTIDLGINASGFVVNQASDRRLKENINTIENALDIVLKLRGVTYNWKDRVNGGDAIRLGFIAQEVQEVIPDLVTENGEYLGVQYKDIPALLVEAIKELVEGGSEYTNTFLKTQTIQAEDNNIELNYNGTLYSSVDGGVTILRGEKESTSLLIDADGNWVSNVNILSEGFVIPEYTPTSSQDTNGVLGNIVQDDDYIYIKRNSGWKRTPKLEDF
jgi:hypothetical protein